MLPVPTNATRSGPVGWCVGVIGDLARKTRTEPLKKTREPSVVACTQQLWNL